jgi:hypothetical protein
MKLSAMVFGPALLAVAVLPAPAQEKKDAALSSTYKVEFRIKDGSGAAGKNGRRYAMLIDTTGRGSLRVGDRVPVATGSNQSGGVLVNTQFTYVDTGVSIDTMLHEAQGKVAINSTIDLSTFVPHKADASGEALQPTISHIKIEVNATMLPGNPTLVASIDDPAMERKFDVEALVTKVE